LTAGAKSFYYHSILASISGSVLPVTITGTAVGGLHPNLPSNNGPRNGGTDAGVGRVVLNPLLTAFVAMSSDLYPAR
jgi:hypothetical protein